jgi:hypothetical protein
VVSRDHRADELPLKSNNLSAAGFAERISQSGAADYFANGILPIVKAARKAGASSLAEIADALNARGVRFASGGNWHRSAVRSLLARAQSCEAVPS